MDWEVGHTVAERYRLVARLGQGGMGSVWRAEHLSLKTPIALKRIDGELVGSQEAIQRFEREAQAAASLRSTHVVQILDHGVDGDTPFIAMELLQGESLADRLAREQRLPARETVDIMTQVGRAMTLAHGAGIVHRDLKPENVFLVREGEQEVVKVLDFGIAKHTSRVQEIAVETRSGTLLGTPYYMSPEQARGDKRVDHRTDLWAMGVIAYECLTGFRPFSGESLGDLLLKICSDPIPVPSKFFALPERFDAWFARALARSPDLRFQSARDFCRELGDALEGAADVTAKAPSEKGGELAETVAFPIHVTLGVEAPPEVPAQSIAGTAPGPRAGHAPKWPWALAGGAVLVLAGLVFARGQSGAANPETVRVVPSSAPSLLPAASSAPPEVEPARPPPPKASEAAAVELAPKPKPLPSSTRPGAKASVPTAPTGDQLFEGRK